MIRKHFDKIIEDLRKDNISAMFFDMEGNLLAGKDMLGEIPIKIYDIAKVFQEQLSDGIKRVVLRGKKKVIYIYPLKNYLFVAVGKKDDEELIKGFVVMFDNY